MGNDESNSNPEKDKSPPKKPKRKIKFQSNYIKSKKINPLIENIIHDITSTQNQPNNENYADIDDWIILGGNNSQRNIIEKKSEHPECFNADLPKHKEKKRPKNLNIDTKNMSNEIENEIDEEEDKKEEKKVSKNKNDDEENVSDIKSISENFQIINEDKIDDDSINDNNIEHKKSIGVRKRKKKTKINLIMKVKVKK